MYSPNGCAPYVCGPSAEWQIDCEGTSCSEAGLPPVDASPDVSRDSAPPCNVLVELCPCTIGDEYPCFPYDGVTYTCLTAVWGPLCQPSGTDAALDAPSDAADD